MDIYVRQEQSPEAVLGKSAAIEKESDIEPSRKCSLDVEI